MKHAPQILALAVWIAAIPSLHAQSDWVDHEIPGVGGAQWAGVVAGDFDQDGDADLMASGASEVRFHENDGAGGFSSSRGWQVGNIPQLGAGDVDGDGDLDIIACGYLTASNLQLAIGENLGHAQFDWTVIFDFPSSSGLLAFEFPADLDLDGDLDLIVRDERNHLAMLRNDGQLNFSYHNIGTSRTWGSIGYLVVRDFNSDQIPDIVTVTIGNGIFLDGIISWWENDGDALFVEHEIDERSNSHLVDAVDLNRDGFAEVLTTYWRTDFSHSLKGYWSQGGPSYSFESIHLMHGWPNFTDGYARGASADFDGDGDIEFAYSRNDAEVLVFDNVGQSSFQLYFRTAGDPNGQYDRIAPAVDLDGDHDLDLVVWSGRKIGWLENVPSAPAFKMTVDQPGGDQTLRISLDGGAPFERFFFVSTQDPRNELGLGSGNFHGLFIPQRELQWKFHSKSGIFRGRLDENGEFSRAHPYLPWGLPHGIPIYGVAVHFPANGPITASSQPIRYVIQ